MAMGERMVQLLRQMGHDKPMLNRAYGDLVWDEQKTGRPMKDLSNIEVVRPCLELVDSSAERPKQQLWARVARCDTTDGDHTHGSEVEAW